MKGNLVQANFKIGSEKLRVVTKPISIDLWFIAVLLVTSSLTRVVLIGANIKELNDSLYMIPISLAVGVIFDLFIALCATLPINLFCSFLPARWKPKVVLRWLTYLTAFIFVFGNMYLIAAEVIFFDEFSSRFNYVAVDYLIYPHEVFVNIWDTYPVLTILLLTGVASFIVVWLAGRKLPSYLLAVPNSFLKRFSILLTHGAIITLMFFLLRSNLAGVSNNRILNEITFNGVYTFFYAGFTNELDYDQYYKRMDEKQAFHRLRQLIGDEHASFLHDESSKNIDRYIASDREPHRFNVVIVLEESFGSNFVGAVQSDGKSLTPQVDSLIHNGLYFSNIYATGNRTVRGLEASLLSLPPIPGRSVVKRPGSEQMFSLPSVLHDLDYNTVFLYGGLSYFDNFGHFAKTNGFDRVFDELDFKEPAFSTIWGVSDEDLFGNALTIFDSLSQLSAPFFATLITVSNHSPYTYPEGRIPYGPEDRSRENVVRYADYAIGKFINDARSHSFFDSTLFVFLADHGARVYGAEEIPMRSYLIPVLFYSPSLIPRAENIAILGSQMDLSPTILDFLGLDYNSMFFGRSLLATSKSECRALMSHNRDVSLLKDDTLVVLNIRGGEQEWYWDESGSLRPVAATGSSPLEEDVIAYYMTAYEMFKNHELHPLQQTSIVK